MHYSEKAKGATAVGVPRRSQDMILVGRMLCKPEGTSVKIKQSLSLHCRKLS